ncbi:multidrug effflux MFS transporter [Shimia sp. CNT1-13L.2]|uniref:multidrug effflux MFS transporter n=1 Tax=Shimia sp. CNT1-13L.2 TaxID=2959663 RepID=UPI0020CD5403|nr:multidrug effflux MFS transporter [Shimia sp. CNT1-13L.2]MCP9480368.1 multidrug effflux MFS transporter [Shimia sp. CNT1-13L.2]
MIAAARTPPRLSTLIILTAVSILTLNMFLPSLANMAADFGVDYALMNLSVAGYLGVTAVLQLVMGPLSDRYGRRPILLGGLVLFTLASVGCWLAQDIWVFLGFRLLQASVISAAALSRAAVRDMVPAQEAAAMLGQIGMVMAIAPMLGPSFGGFLDQWFGWRASFAVFTLLGVGMMVLAWVDMGETNSTPSETFAAQFRSYPELIRSRRFWGYSLCLAFSVGAFYAFITGAALVAGEVFGLTPAQVGIGIGSITGGFAFGNFLSGRLAKTRSLTVMMLAGRVVACGGLLVGIVLVMADVVSPISYFGCVVFVGLGNGLTLPAASAGAMSVRPQLAGSASGLSGALMVAGGALLTMLTGAVLSPENGVELLLWIMLASAGGGLLAALYVRRIDLREGTTH